ncbi:MAG: DUF3634 family protein [Planctomycetes bacterium]|nr:DUF3634 family protein [Planctomycetota bacterium]
MLDLLVKFLAVGLVLAVCWIAIRPRYTFVVRIKAGSPRVTRGKVAVTFLRRIAEVCERNRVQRGWVGGIQKERRIALAFSRHIPPDCRQQLRNEWLLFG